MPCNHNPATGEVETLMERYQRESEVEFRIEQKERMAMAMRAVDQVAPQMGRISHIGLIASWDRRSN
jgi:hypothetical protein